MIPPPPSTAFAPNGRSGPETTRCHPRHLSPLCDTKGFETPIGRIAYGMSKRESLVANQIYSLTACATLKPSKRRCHARLYAAQNPPLPIQPLQPIHSFAPPLLNMPNRKIRFWSSMDPDRPPHSGALAPSVHSLSYRAVAGSIGCQETTPVAASNLTGNRRGSRIQCGCCADPWLISCGCPSDSSNRPTHSTIQRSDFTPEHHPPTRLVMLPSPDR